MKAATTGTPSPEANDRREDVDMSTDPDAIGNPSEDAQEYLKDANADDPRSDPRAPATEPAGRENPDEPRPIDDTDPL